MKKLDQFLLFGFLSASMQTLASDMDPPDYFTTDNPPFARVSYTGSMAIYTMPKSAECYGNKINVSQSEDENLRDMVLSLVTAAQMSDRNIKVWVERFDTTTPQRCRLKYIQIEPRE